jgi:hypothetical protein
MKVKEASNQMLLFELCLCNAAREISKILQSDGDYEQWYFLGFDAV